MEFLVFGEDWQRHPSSTQHLFALFNQQHPVYWINSIGLRQPSISSQDIIRVVEKIKAFKSLPVTKHKLLAQPTKTITPLVWPLPQNKLIKKINQQLLKHQLPIKQEFRVIWCSLPSAVDYLDICDGDIVVYYCGDDFSALAGVDHTKVARLEQQLIQQADVIFAASSPLQQKFPPEKTHLLPHGVDLDLFTPPALPIDKDQIKTVGFYGSLNTWLDYDLIIRLAQQCPEITFHFVGKKECPASHTLIQQNIQLHPPCSHPELISHLTHWDCAIMPFINNRQIQHCNPLKLREYLASARHIICSDFPAAQQYSSHLTIANNTQQWLNALKNPIPITEQKITMRRQILSTESWQARQQQVIAELQSLISP
ncbi:glycosyltransferase family 1 protein [Photobacterium damselae subsp. damselae]|uniref:glycosyltransferase family 1 protein n=1 Tax=Photobacterium damselae TaxID=38293 RepID=UPI000D04AE13|nr:glycosyltransferase family 1 protein [Photobacterium damselae]PSB91377.1 glycosyltransferase family 1 protein [Photobacterium damselae subsp. damselae]